MVLQEFAKDHDDLQPMEKSISPNNNNNNNNNNNKNDEEPFVEPNMLMSICLKKETSDSFNLWEFWMKFLVSTFRFWCAKFIWHIESAIFTKKNYLQVRIWTMKKKLVV